MLWQNAPLGARVFFAALTRRARFGWRKPEMRDGTLRAFENRIAVISTAKRPLASNR
jgi:hypothetical protein